MFTKNLSVGSFGPDVYRLQNILETFRFGDFVPTGYYGEKTKAAIAKYQKYYNIAETGIFSDLTRTIMNEALVSPREFLYCTALHSIGVDASPNDIAPDEYGCAETVNDIHKRAFGISIGGDISTYRLYAALQSHPLFVRVDVPMRGDIIISPTGYGSGALPNGHVGYMQDAGKIMSNSSYSGKFEQNYTLVTWKNRYVDIGGYPMVFFRRL